MSNTVNREEYLKARGWTNYWENSNENRHPDSCWTHPTYGDMDADKAEGKQLDYDAELLMYILRRRPLSIDDIWPT